MRLKIVFLTLISIFACSIFTSAQQKRTPSMSSEYGGTTQSSELHGVLRGDKGLSIPIAISKGDYTQFRRAWVVKNKTVMDDLIDDGGCFIVNSGTAVRVLAYDSVYLEDGSVDIIRVYVRQGVNQGKEGWTDAGFFTETSKVNSQENDAEDTVDEVRFSIGDNVVLNSTLSYSTVLLFTNEQAFEDARSEGESRRLGLISQMIDTGRVLEIPNGSEAVVNDLKKITVKGKIFEMIKVRILSKGSTSKIGWTFATEAKKK